MIDSSVKIPPSVTALPPRSPAPVERLENDRDAPPRSEQPPREDIDSARAETLRAQHQEFMAREDGDTDQAAAQPLRVKRAMLAYHSLQTIEQRAYVTQVLGIDEFV